eukprot:EG_transcript_700
MLSSRRKSAGHPQALQLKIPKSISHSATFENHGTSPISKLSIFSQLRSTGPDVADGDTSTSSQDGSTEEMSELDKLEKERRERRIHNHDRNLERIQHEQEELVKHWEEREAYREQRRLAAKLGPREEAHRRRVQQWLQVYFTVSPLWALKRLARLQQCRDTLRLLLAPRLKLRVHLMRKRKRLALQREELLHVMKQPTFQMLSQREFFKMWPEDSLRRMCYKLEPVKFTEGEYIMFDGDPGDRMYFLETGKVDIIIRSKGPSKCRTRRNGFVVATLGPGAHFGEFALLNDEPRMASIQCMEDCTCWTLGKADFRAEIFTRPQTDPLRVSMVENANNRRKMNMRKLYPLTKKQLSAQPEFSGWSVEELEHISAQVQPVVARGEEVIFHEGAVTDCAFFVATGRLQVWKKTRWWRTVMSKEGATPSGSKDGKMWDAELGELLTTLSTGDIFGEIGCVYFEPQPYCVKAITNVDLWQLPRQQWKDVMLRNASHFIQAKAMVNKKRAVWVDPLPCKAVLECDVLRRAFGQKLASKLPCVIEALEPLVLGDGDVVTNTGLLFLVSGCLESRKSRLMVTPGASVGGERFSNTAVADDELKSHGKSEMWLFSLLSYRKLAVEEPNLLDLVPTRKDSQSRNLTKTASFGSSHLRGTAAFQPKAVSSPNADHKFLCGSPVKSAKLLVDRAGDPPRSTTPTSSDLARHDSDLRRHSSESSDANAERGEEPHIPGPKKRIFAASRATHALKFAAGFMPPGFMNNSDAMLDKRRMVPKKIERQATTSLNGENDKALGGSVSRLPLTRHNSFHSDGSNTTPRRSKGTPRGTDSRRGSVRQIAARRGSSIDRVVATPSNAAAKKRSVLQRKPVPLDEEGPSNELEEMARNASSGSTSPTTEAQGNRRRSSHCHKRMVFRQELDRHV